MFSGCDTLLSFIPCHTKYSQSEYMKAVVCLTVLNPIFSSCAVIFIFLMKYSKCIFYGMVYLPVCILRKYEWLVGYSVVYHAKVLHNYSLNTYPRGMNGYRPANLMLGIALWWTIIPSREVYCGDSPSPVMLWKLGWPLAWWVTRVKRRLYLTYLHHWRTHCGYLRLLGISQPLLCLVLYSHFLWEHE